MFLVRVHDGSETGTEYQPKNNPETYPVHDRSQHYSETKTQTGSNTYPLLWFHKIREYLCALLTIFYHDAATWTRRRDLDPHPCSTTSRQTFLTADKTLYPRASHSTPRFPNQSRIVVSYGNRAFATTYSRPPGFNSSHASEIN
jgi:hypothetical protein